ncbi:MAG: aldo/keto reductase family oxidoreductase [Olsenella profusa]
MKKLNILEGPSGIPAIALGLMHMPALAKDEAARVLANAVDLGVNFFDEATCYAQGEAERRFGEAFPLSGLSRDQIVMQTKCGLEFARGFFDHSKANILKSVDESLERMGLDYVDVLLLHRPDLLMDPEEVADAFDELHASGKVLHFGVSNFSPMMIELLKKHVRVPLVFDQMSLSLEQSQLIDQGLYVNNLTTERSVDRDNETFNYCRVNDITIQTWSSLSYGFPAGGKPGGCFVDSPEFPELNAALQELADRYGTTKAGIAIAWITSHPAHMQAIVGTMSPDHLRDIVSGADVTLAREEWYGLYLASGKYLP